MIAESALKLNFKATTKKPVIRESVPVSPAVETIPENKNKRNRVIKAVFAGLSRKQLDLLGCLRNTLTSKGFDRFEMGKLTSIRSNWTLPLLKGMESLGYISSFKYEDSLGFTYNITKAGLATLKQWEDLT